MFQNVFKVSRGIPESKTLKVLSLCADFASKDFEQNSLGGLKNADVRLEFGTSGLSLTFTADIRYDLLLSFLFHKAMMEEFGGDCFSKIELGYCGRLHSFLPDFDRNLIRKFDKSIDLFRRKKIRTPKPKKK